ncbi:hypothetical protein F5884DRAFT_859514 [Xylogone sp. PMI_703]|nr:hypothetical protein F5884DRAFT_859514 [Xylogone sp. PMI_703]
MSILDRVWGYSKLHTSEVDPELEGPLLSEDTTVLPQQRTLLRHIVLIPIVAVVFFAGISLGILLNLERAPSSELTVSPQPTRCSNPVVRKEWRSLSTQEKDVYLGAVKCLGRVPSVVNPNSTLHDDFAWIHSRIGKNSHNSAAFLAWHRYFIHLYETTLREKCSFNGNLPYWDWSLDWESLFSSPVFSSTHGFGGNGNTSLSPILNFGTCVTEGPFADLTLSFAGQETQSHCLTRSFQDEGLRGYSGEGVSPAAIEEVLSKEDYASFFSAIEEGPHDTIPNMIRGDFWYLTAPNEPTFFLHHGMLDRLWWMWQQRDPENRLRQYIGPASNGSMIAASLHDEMDMGTFAKAVHANDVVDAQAGILCYRYS